MTGASFAYRRAYLLPAGYSVEFALDGPSLKAEWLPDFPRGKIARKLLPHYQHARNNFLASLGVNVLVIET